MPRGTKQEVTGLLLREGRRLVLEIDDGGRWQLDAGAEAHGFLGRRVRVEGVRSGFDLLDVRSIKAA